MAGEKRNPKLGFYKGRGQYCICINRRRVYLGTDQEKAEPDSLCSGCAVRRFPCGYYSSPP